MITGDGLGRVASWQEKHTFAAERLSLGDLGHEVSLLLLQVGREALVLGLLNDLLDGFPFHRALGLGLFLHSSRHSSVVLLQRFAEVGVGLSLVVEVHGIGYVEDTIISKGWVPAQSMGRIGLVLTQQAGQDRAGGGDNQSGRLHYGFLGVVVGI